MPKRTRTRLVKPEDLLRLVTVSDAQISPDGSKVAFVRKHVNDRNQYVTSIWTARADGTGVPTAFTHGPKDSHPRWSPDGSRLAFIRTEAEKPPQIAVMPAAGGEARVASHMAEGAIAAFAWSPNGRRIAFTWRRVEPELSKAAEKSRKERGGTTPPRVIDHAWYRLDGDGYFGAERFHLYMLDVDRGSSKKIFDEDTLGDFTFDFSPDGRTIAIACNRHADALLTPATCEVVLLDVERGSVRAIPGLPPGPKSSPRFSPDGRSIAWAGRKGAESAYDTRNLELWSSDLHGRRARSLTGKQDYCTMAATLSDTADASFAPSFRWAPDGESLFLRVGWHGEGRLASISREGGAIRFHTEGIGEHTFGTLSGDGRRIAMVYASPTAPPEVVVAEVNGAIFPKRQLTRFNGSLTRELKLVEPTSHWVRSGRGKVHLWVIRPPKGAPSRRGAAVLEVHGGPHAQYGTAFFHEFQVLASSGYTVVYSNPRGSKGYGERWCGAIKGSWGKADWEDVKAVTSFMKRLKGVAPNRVGIMGGSYGGYMTNWAVGHSRGYRAAITDRCVSNLISMCGSSDFPEVPDLYWPGAPWKNPKAMWEASPIAHFKGARTPMLIVHSEGDLRCNIEQAEQVHAALVVQGVPCRFVRYPRETSHGMSRSGPPDMRLHRLHEILSWWEKWLA